MSLAKFLVCLPSDYLGVRRCSPAAQDRSARDTASVSGNSGLPRSPAGMRGLLLHASLPRLHPIYMDFFLYIFICLSTLIYQADPGTEATGERRPSADFGSIAPLFDKEELCGKFCTTNLG